MVPAGKCCLSFLPKNTNIAFDVLKGMSKCSKLGGGYIGVNGTSYQPIVTHIG